MHWDAPSAPRFGPKPEHISALAVFLAVMVLGIWLMFVPPYIGMADNGDFYRIIKPAGLYHLDTLSEDIFFDYYIREYGIYQYHNQYAQTFYSSQALFVGAAVWLDTLLTGDALFDLRVQAAMLLPLMALCAALMTRTILNGNRHPVAHVFTVALAAWIFADSAYLAYFASFFGESVVLIATVAMTGALLMLTLKRHRGFGWLSLYMVSALLLISSKQQNSPVGILLVPITLHLIWLHRDRLWRGVCAACAVVLAVTAVGMYAIIPDDFVNINKYHAMTRGILLQADNPEEALAEFGIDPQYSVLADTIYYDRVPLISPDDPALQSEFYAKYSFTKILAYYLRHPGKLISMLDLATQYSFTVPPQAMGNFEQSTGMPPGAQTDFFRTYSKLKANLTPDAFAGVLFYFLLVFIADFGGFKRALRERNVAGMLPLEIDVTLGLIGVSQMVISIVGAGDADLAKHLFLFNVCFDILMFLLLARTLRALAGKLIPLKKKEAAA